MTLEMLVLDEVVADDDKKGAQLVARGVRGFSHMISANLGTWPHRPPCQCHTRATYQHYHLLFG